MIDLPHPPQTLTDFIGYVGQRYSEFSAVGCEDGSLTYAELEVMSRRLAAWFKHELDLKAGDRVMVQLPNQLNYPVVLFAAFRAGLIVVSLDTNSSFGEITRIAKETEARAYVYCENCEQARAFIDGAPSLIHGIETRKDDLASWWRKGVRQFFKQLLPVQRRRSIYALVDLLSVEATPGYVPPQMQSDHLAMIQYTSGATGLSKGVMLSHRNLIANLSQVTAALESIGIQGAQRLLLPLPLYHSYPLMLALTQWFQGGCVQLVNDARDTHRIAEQFDRIKPTMFAGISPIFNALTRHSLFSQLDLSYLKSTVSGAAPVSDALAERWALITGCTLTQAYGVAEASPVISMDTRGISRSGCVGRPLIGTQVRIVDQSGNSIPAGGVGEIQVTGPQVSNGYWRNPEATAKRLTADGWLRTEDIGRLSLEGELYFVERAAEVIQVGGFRVFPSDVEAIVNAHPDVIDCAVVSVPDSLGIMQLKIFVVSNNRRLTQKQVRDYCRERLTRYKVPALVEFRRELPHSAIGKVLRKQLLEESSLG